MEIFLGAGLGLIVGAVVNRVADGLIAARALPDQQHRLRAPIIVIVAALAFAFLSARFGVTIQFALTAIYTTIFLVVLVTDLEHRLIFDVVILPAALFAALVSPLSVMGWKFSLLGGVIAFIIVLGIYLCAEIFARARKLQIAGGVFGQGDVKLAAFMGIVVGFPAVFPAILYTILLGGVGAILFLAYQLVVHRRVALTATIPYGPFFCIAGWWMMVA
ncbi:MAG: A24 family peptidase [Anaerolineales bacterium]|nr:A24 family peptidase [Anaerolineales bacterium]